MQALSRRAVVITFRINPGIRVLFELYFEVADYFSFSRVESQATPYIQTLIRPMSTHAP